MRTVGARIHEHSPYGAGKPEPHEKGGITGLWDEIRRAFAEFLTIPSVVIVVFLDLAAGSYTLENAESGWFQAARAALRKHVVADSQATGELLGTIAGGIITLTSIIISLLLVALQQSAASLTHQVFDQFLRRRVNQFYFGFFVGLSLFALVTLATVTESFNPVFGASLALLLTVVALYILLLLLYTTINQMRPAVIIDEIHTHTLAARQYQRSLIMKTRRSPRAAGLIRQPVKAQRHGFVTAIDIDAMGAVARSTGEKTEVVLGVSIGSYRAFDDVVAEITAPTDEAAKLAQAVQGAIHFENQRDIVCDPAYGVEQMEMIAWTSISTAKSNPAPGLLVQSLRDILARWSVEDYEDPKDEPVPVVYTHDVFRRLMNTFETLAVVSSESMQHQSFAELIRTLAAMFDRLPAAQQRRAEDIILRIISALGEFVLTAELDSVLSALAGALKKSGRLTTAAAVEAAQDRLKRRSANSTRARLVQRGIR